MEHVILGASAAGMSALRAIRERDPGAGVTVVSDERPHFRPMIPMLVSGEKKEDEIGWPEDAGPRGERFVSARAVSVDAVARSVALSDGTTLGYDRLLIATGAAARVPDAPGIEGDGVYAFRRIDDAAGIAARAKSAKRAVVIGGGFAGVKAAEALAKAGLSVTVLEQIPQILMPRLDEKGAGIIRAALEAKGITARTSDTAAEILSDGSLRGVRTASGETLDAELVVYAVGTIPNTGFLAGSSVDTGAAVTTDETLMTSAQGVYAAGDAAESFDVLTGQKAVCALWSSAVSMGRIAGLNMSGDRLKFPGLLPVKNATEIAGVPVVSVGMVSGDGLETVSLPGRRLHRMLAFNGDTLAGAVFMGELRGAGLYTSLIANRTRLSPAQKQRAMDDELGYADFAAKSTYSG